MVYLWSRLSRGRSGYFNACGDTELLHEKEVIMGCGMEFCDRFRFKIGNLKFFCEKKDNIIGERLVFDPRYE